MSYDVAIGKCRGITETSVEVWVDGSVVRRLQPDSSWQKDGISVLRVPIEACSRTRAPKLKEEVFLGSEQVNSALRGSLDIDGSGTFESVRLSRLIPEVDSPVARPVSRKNTWR